MITDPGIEQYCKAHSKPESYDLQALREYTEANVHGAHMLSGVLVGRTLQLFLKELAAKRVLDLGTYTGYSALSMAEVLPEDGTVLTCDKSPQQLEVARRFFAKSQHGKKITIFEGTVINCIATLADASLDFAFVDADKLELLTYINLLYPKLRRGGMIVVDNALGVKAVTVLDSDDKTLHALRVFNAAIRQDARFMNLLLPIREGLNIMTTL